MRKLIVTNIVSLDGYYEGPGRNVMVLPMDPAFDAYCAQRLRSATTLLCGADTYRGFVSYWPPVAERPDEREVEREISRRNNEIEKVVVSDSLTTEETGPWRDTTRIVRRAAAHKEIAELKRGEGGDILAFGSRTLWNDLWAAGLVDEVHFILGAVVLDGGTPAFEHGLKGPLRLVGFHAMPDSDNLLVQYAKRGLPYRY
jgi:dihydrofolate reductase